MATPQQLIPGTLWRHRNGHLYRVMHVAIHTETGEDLVVYQAMYGRQRIWVRPAAMFLDGRFTLEAGD